MNTDNFNVLTKKIKESGIFEELLRLDLYEFKPKDGSEDVLVGICQFCDAPESMQYRKTLQIVYCMGCHKGGDVLTFVCLKNDYSPIEAINYIAHRFQLDWHELHEFKADMKIECYKDNGFKWVNMKGKSPVLPELLDKVWVLTEWGVFPAEIAMRTETDLLWVVVEGKNKKNLDVVNVVAWCPKLPIPWIKPKDNGYLTKPKAKKSAEENK